METNKLQKNRKIISNILSYSLIGLLFLIVTMSLIYKTTDQPFYFYNLRYDVVLTDSMSRKNEEHLDFLKGHNDQIQAFDFVVSEKITDDTKLDVYDIVIFNNPSIGTDMHRIVNVENVGDTFELDYIKRDRIANYDVFKFSELSSSIFLKTAYSFTDIEIVTYSETPFEEDEFHFMVNNVPIEVEATYQESNSTLYRNTIKYHRNSKSPATFTITKRSYEFNSYFESIKLYRGSKHCLITPKVINGQEKQMYMDNISQKYLIRGDKAKTDDGWYTREQIQSKVIRVLPKFGYVARFLSSPYGAIMIIGLACIPIIYWMIFDKKEKKTDENKK